MVKLTNRNFIQASLLAGNASPRKSWSEAQSSQSSPKKAQIPDEDIEDPRSQIQSQLCPNKSQIQSQIQSQILSQGQRYIQGMFGCKEVGGSKEMGKYNCSLSYLSKYRKRKNKKILFSFLFSLLHNHFLFSRVLQLLLWSCKSHL